MRLEPEGELLHYRLVEEIGAGGMGVVWKAVDTSLDREVAIKVLPSAFADDEDRLARFEREAKLLASINHPNIATVHGLHQASTDAGQVRFLAMELVAGEDLAQRLAPGPLPVEDALDFARQVAVALEAAHERSVIHRDLKPANVRITPEGQVKVLDFGLAKTIETPRPTSSSDPARAAFSPTVTTAGTIPGVILGTVSYMSPEQARGRPVDRRTDIWSFGCLLYEMLSGTAAFGGEDAMEILAATIHREPDWERLPPGTPDTVRRLLERCLRKDPRKRQRDMGDVALELEQTSIGSTDGTDTPSSAPMQSSRRSAPIAWLAIVVVAALAAFAIGYRTAPDPDTGIAVQRTPTLTRLTSEDGAERFASLGPNGGFILYASDADGDDDIYILRVGGDNAINVTPESNVSDTQPAISPDGMLIAFRSERDGGGIFVMGSTGESVRRVTDRGYNPAWSPDGSRLAFSSASIDLPFTRSGIAELWSVELASGEMRQVYAGDAVQPSWSPNGRRLAFWGLQLGTGMRDLWTIDADGGEPVPVTVDDSIDWNPVWSPDGRHLYFSSDRSGSMNLWRVPIDTTSGALLGPPEAVTIGASASRHHISFSADGSRVAYVEYLFSAHVQHASLDPDTLRVSPGEFVTQGSQRAERPAVSPDGAWIAFNSSGTQEDIFVIATDGTGRRQLTHDIYKDRQPRWSPDGETLAFYSDRSGSYEIWTIRPDGSQLRQLTDTPGKSLVHPVWSPDGSRIMCIDNHDRGIVMLDLSASDGSVRLENLPNHEGVFSPYAWSQDGSRVLGDSKRGGIVEYSVTEREYRELTDIGRAPRWMQDGRRILFLDGGAIHALDTTTGERRPVFALRRPATIARPFSLSSDDRNLYFTRSADQADVWLLSYE